MQVGQELPVSPSMSSSTASSAIEANDSDLSSEWDASSGEEEEDEGEKVRGGGERERGGKWVESESLVGQDQGSENKDSEMDRSVSVDP